MRTTLTLDDDVVSLLEQIQKQRNSTLKEVVNAALREGLVAMAKPPEPRSRFQTRSFETGKCLIPNIENIAEALAIAEGEDFR